MVDIICGLVMLALSTFFAVVMWKMSLRAWFKEIKSLATSIRNKTLRFDRKLVLLELVWSACSVYVIFVLIKIGVESIAVVAKGIMEVIE